MATTLWAALRARLAAKWRKTKAAGVKGAATTLYEGAKKPVVALLVALLVVGLAWTSVPWLPESWQGPVLAVFEKVAPATALPKNPRNKTGHVGIGPKGYGNASDLFRAAAEQGTTTVDLDPALQGPVLVCHEWEGSGADDAAVLRALAAAHPRCFTVADRDGGGFFVSPRIGDASAGDVIKGADGTVLGYACGCAARLDVIRSALGAGRSR